MGSNPTLSAIFLFPSVKFVRSAFAFGSLRRDRSAYSWTRGPLRRRRVRHHIKIKFHSDASRPVRFCCLLHWHHVPHAHPLRRSHSGISSKGHSFVQRKMRCKKNTPRLDTFFASTLCSHSFDFRKRNCNGILSKCRCTKRRSFPNDSANRSMTRSCEAAKG